MPLLGISTQVARRPRTNRPLSQMLKKKRSSEARQENARTCSVAMPGTGPETHAN